MKNIHIAIFLLVLVTTSTACQMSASLEGTQNTMLANDLPTDKSALANLLSHQNSKAESDSVTVTITADLVNLRFISTGTASGEALSRGDVVLVEWRDDGYGAIVSPDQYAGYMVWRGCTSDAGTLGCEAK